MRTFIAIALPHTLQRAVVVWQRQLRQQLQMQSLAESVRWTPVEKLHLTLRFLGDTTLHQHTQIEQSLSVLAAGKSAFALTLHALGCFPNFRRPNIVWLDFLGDVAVLASMQQQIERAARQAGFPAEARPFTPHLTIGRASTRAASTDLQHAGAVLRQCALEAGQPQQAFAPFTAQQILFMQSELRPDGAVYAVLSTHKFLGIG